MNASTWFRFAGLSALLSGCSLLGQAGLNIGYSFDPQEFKQSIGQEGGPTNTLPTIACTPGASPDPCAAAQSTLPPQAMSSCDSASSACVAQVIVRLPQQIDLRQAMTPVPSQAVEFGIGAVAIDKVNYWAASNTLNVATPPIDVYVAAATAKDETDATAVKLGSIASLPAKSRACGDPQDPHDAATQQGNTVCSMPITSAGQAALSQFIKNYKTSPFQLIVRATLVARGGTPIPAGTIDVFVRPSVTLSILK